MASGRSFEVIVRVVDSSRWVGARLAEVLPLPLESKQRLLELGDGLRRLEILQRLLTRASTARGGSEER